MSLAAPRMPPMLGAPSATQPWPCSFAPAPMASLGFDVNHDGRADMFVTGTDLNRDGIPDILQGAGGVVTTTAMHPQPCSFAPAQPYATVGIDVNHDGRADFMVSGADFNQDGIPDVLQGPGATAFSTTYASPPMRMASTRTTMAVGAAANMVSSYAPPAATVQYSTTTRSTTPRGSLKFQPGAVVAHRAVQAPTVVAQTSVQPAPTSIVVQQPPVEVVQPIIKEVVREVPVNKTELHTIYREQHQVEVVEKPVSVPTVEVREIIQEVPLVLNHERIVEVPEVRQADVVKQVPRVEYQEVTKSVAVPVCEPRERIVEVPATCLQESIVEVPEVQCIELIREVPKTVVEKVPKHIERPVVELRERRVEVPAITTKEQIVAVPVIETVEMLREVPRPELQQVEKHVELPQVELRERVVEVPQSEFIENPVEVPEVEYCEVVKQVPKYEVHYIDKQVIKHQVEYIEKLVEVPHIVYEERIVEVPEIEHREIIRHVPKTTVQVVDKPVPKHMLQVVKRTVDVPTTLTQEQPVEVPEVQWVESVTHVPKPQTEYIPREVPKIVGVQAQERVEEVPIVVRQERPFEVEQVQYVDAIKQELRVQVQIVDKVVPKMMTEVVEKIVEVSQQPLVEEVPVPVPQVMTVEALREEAVEHVQQAVREVPKVNMEYRERRIEMRSSASASAVQANRSHVPVTVTPRVSTSVTCPTTPVAAARITRSLSPVRTAAAASVSVTPAAASVSVSPGVLQLPQPVQMPQPVTSVHIPKPAVVSYTSVQQPVAVAAAPAVTVGAATMVGGSMQVLHGQTSVVQGGYAAPALASASYGSSSVRAHSRSVSPSRRTAAHTATSLGFVANGVVSSVEDLRRDRSHSPAPAGLRASLVTAGSLVQPPPIGAVASTAAATGPTGVPPPVGLRPPQLGGVQSISHGTANFGGAAYGTATFGGAMPPPPQLGTASMSGMMAGSAPTSAFDAIDRNHDGVITRAEFNQALQTSGMLPPPPGSFGPPPQLRPPFMPGRAGPFGR